MTPPNHILVFVPGYLGSTLRDPKTGRDVWLDFSTLPPEPWRWDNWLDTLFERMTYPSDLEVSGVLNDVVVISPFIKQEQYGRLFVALKDMGYVLDGDERDITAYKFPYDWRQDNRISARQLGKAIEHWRSLHPGAQVWIIAHSNGGVVARWYVEKEGGKDVVQRMFLMGSPYDGTPKVMRIAFNGADMLMRPGLDPAGIAARTRKLFRTFPSLYQLMPVRDRFLQSLANEAVDPFNGKSWLDEPRQIDYLIDGQRFTSELGDTSSVETICFFGRKRPTLTSGRVRLEAAGKWDAIEWGETEAGDGTIPERSAAHPNASQRLPFVVSHGDIYIHPPVLEALRWELIDKFTDGLDKALVATESMRLSFNPDKDAYRENETIWLYANLTDLQDTPLTNSAITVTIQWEKPLPGDPPPKVIPADVTVNLVPLARKPGYFEGLLYGPAENGYHRLVARAVHPDLGEAEATELIAVETVN